VPFDNRIENIQVIFLGAYIFVKVSSSKKTELTDIKAFFLYALSTSEKIIIKGI
jgi:hypothetical protein